MSSSTDFSRYESIVVLTGAGISVASGLAPYRGPGGIWNDHDVERYGHVDCLYSAPEKVWELFGRLRPTVRGATPNAAHTALARFEAALGPHQRFTLITQNIDGLHFKAGSRNVLELHGNLLYTRCTKMNCSYARHEDHATHARQTPLCPVCLSPLRPDIVLFGEMLPPQLIQRAQAALQECDLFLAVGTSGTVAPAADFVRLAARRGAHTVLLNLEPIEGPQAYFQEEILGRAERLLPALLG